MGMEGDPCYRGTAGEAPKATVLDVHRDAEGFVRFRAQLDGQRGILDLDNRNLSPDRIWEVDPEYLETFRGDVEAATVGETGRREEAREEGPSLLRDSLGDSLGDSLRDSLGDEGEREKEEKEEGHEFSKGGSTDESSYRSTVDSALDAMRERLEALETSERTFRDTMAGTVRELAGDLLRASRGDALAFAGRYADRYDLALHERVEGGGGGSSSEFRAASSNDRHQREKYDFRAADDEEEEYYKSSSSVTPLQYKEDTGNLTD
jgi:hypothetical protein